MQTFFVCQSLFCGRWRFEIAESRRGGTHLKVPGEAQATRKDVSAPSLYALALTAVRVLRFQ
jgi:hypothetical protein